MTGEKKPGPETGKKPGDATDGAETEHHAETLEALAGEYEPAGQGKPGEKQKAEGDTVSAEQIAQLYQTGFALVSLRAGDHWKLSDGEAKEIGTATDAVLTKYLGETKMGPELALLFTGVAVIGPRVALTVAMQNQQQGPQKPAANDDGQQQGTGTDGN
ncbi:MAG: hypothetical protein CL550_06420 [Alcanivorax sp.]|nr:hypothetical protein [Alcanivorax sp.]